MSADSQKKPAPAPTSTMTPSYVKKNKDNLSDTFKTDDSMDYNKKIRKFFGAE